MADKKRTHKYLDDCGFVVFSFGVHKNGNIDISNGDGEDVCVGVTEEQGEQIMKYIENLESRVEKYIELHYWK